MQCHANAQVENAGTPTRHGSPESQVHKRSTWFQAAMIIIGETIGTGVLGLPKVHGGGSLIWILLAGI